MTDRLNIPSRNFFERTKLKLSASISIAGIGVMLLGFCAFSAGQAASYNTMVRYGCCGVVAWDSRELRSHLLFFCPPF